MTTEPICIKQGAEARVYELSTFLTIKEGCIAKERFKKTYRHPDLDRQLTARRVTQEARCLYRCNKAGMDTPAVYLVDIQKATIYMEKIVGTTFKRLLLDNQHNQYSDLDLAPIADKIGKALAKMHSIDIIHGDLTTSNMMLRENGSVVTIDFGLSYGSSMPEDKAVDLYVLERAFSSTHPSTEQLFANILASYIKHYKQSKPIMSKLEEVRLRGRKRTMIG
ncbi:kinase-like domain-containing protein [Halteromyces radiatus]|uniref:kinase-like domain-containing protein n=1 Tax=Halteromyces radiatus TaxID=101107 RepID=UPI0022200591|nr:kinase-like domain-containing protein [Halteromyces radiatus]KAI8086413.1 kinase-like domain-containing protein [Halteromyces radiatus]